jgi:hypothetical protein
MTTLALDLLGVPGRNTFTAPIIFSARNGFQVTRFDASTIAANVIGVKSLGNRAYAKLVDDPLYPSALILGILYEFRIAILVKVTLPNPAPVFHLDQVIERKVLEF